MIELKEQSAIASPDTAMEDFETYAGLVAQSQRAVMWWIGDLARMAERRWPATWNQIFPVWMSPDLIARCKAVSEAYPADERNIEANWTIHMQSAKKPDRVALVSAHVEAGHTSDEARKNPAPVIETPAVTQEPATPAEAEKEGPRWLLAVDVNYFIHSYFHSGAGVEAASTFDAWLWRLIDRLAYKSPTNPQKGLTDVVCCFDGRDNHRKKLTEGWESPYKPRAEKEQELAGQLNVAPEMLKKRGLACVSIDGMEADDLLASYAVHFPGRVTLLTEDKDMRQCLKSGKVNMLTDVTWETNTETGASLPVYLYVNAQQHIDEGCKTYKAAKGEVVKGITPEQWPHFQAIAGDTGDGIKGCVGIGAKGAMDLILAHGTVHGVIEAAKSGLIALTEKKRIAVLEFAEVADIMLQLTTLKTDLNVPMITRLCLAQETT